MTASSSPVLGQSVFTLICSNAPSSAYPIRIAFRRRFSEETWLARRSAWERSVRGAGGFELELAAEFWRGFRGALGRICFDLPVVSGAGSAEVVVVDDRGALLRDFEVELVPES